MRFDDTSSAEETIEIEKTILADLELLEIKLDLFKETRVNPLLSSNGKKFGLSIKR